MNRSILHVDANAFYASVEQQRNPSLRNKPIAVCGSQEERHGIVLTASYPAKRRGVKTGMAIWQAKQQCPELIVVPPDMKEYIRISRLARDIYEDYTDQVEPFGLDEAWLDITGSVGLFGSPLDIAQQISDRIKLELGITVSIGVSYNKITAKLGSDYKKPDAITRIERDNYEDSLFMIVCCCKRIIIRCDSTLLCQIDFADSDSFLETIIYKRARVCALAFVFNVLFIGHFIFYTEAIKKAEVS